MNINFGFVLFAGLSSSCDLQVSNCRVQAKLCKQFDYDIVATSVSAYSDSVSTYSDRDCFSRYIYIFFRFVFFRKFLEILFCKFIKNGSGTVTLFQLFTAAVSAVVSASHVYS
jgi:hypothetical protein